MHSFAAAGAAFLICVLWFDLMFDVQVRGHHGDSIPEAPLASISAYYRRVTREAWPMNRLIALVMLLTLLVIVLEIVLGRYHWWIEWLSRLRPRARSDSLARAQFRTRRDSAKRRIRLRSKAVSRARSTGIICTASRR